MKNLLSFFTVVLAIFLLTFGCKIYKYDDGELLYNPVIANDASRDIGKTKYKTNDGKTFNTKQEYIDYLAGTIPLVEKLEGNKAKINLVIPASKYEGEAYLYGFNDIVKTAPTYSSKYGVGPATDSVRGFAKFDREELVAGSGIYVYSVTLDVVTNLADSYATTPTKYSDGGMFFFSICSTYKGAWDDLGRKAFNLLLREKGADGGKRYVFKDYQNVHLRIDFANAAENYQITSAVVTANATAFAQTGW
ncbi:MAG TPA: hypothetical protein PLO89_10750 [Spirochaetota bacterium]|nr:hypothetical protein [Spirochaetota bacterium]